MFLILNDFACSATFSHAVPHIMYVYDIIIGEFGARFNPSPMLK